jgi:putative holliday junction resolvase
MIIGLDIGKRRVGVAVMHEESLLPVPLETIDRTKEDLVGRIGSLLAKHDCNELVIGYPRRQNGLASEQTAYTELVAKQINNAYPTLVIAFQDESATSLLAEEELRQSRKVFSKEAIDQLAAVYILQDYAQQKRRA